MMSQNAAAAQIPPSDSGNEALPYQELLERTYAGRLEKAGQGFLTVPTTLFVQKLDLGLGAPPLPEADFYIKNDSGEFEVLRQKDQPYSSLALSSHSEIYVQEEFLPVLQDYAEARLTETRGEAEKPGAEPSDKAKKRMDSLRKAAILTVDELFQNPSPENIKKSTRVVGSFVSVLMKEPQTFMYLAQLSSHDPYTLQHSVGAAVNSIILAKKVGIREEFELNEVGMAGLLHDLGKTKVDTQIINKDGPLDQEEWEKMQQHSEHSYELIKDIQDLTERTKRAVLEHHEEKNGGGYPQGLTYDQVDIYSKIVCLADIFNALTTNRSYSKARTPFEAFKLIREKLMNKVDDRLFEALVKVYGGELKDL